MSLISLIAAIISIVASLTTVGRNAVDVAVELRGVPSTETSNTILRPPPKPVSKFGPNEAFVEQVGENDGLRPNHVLQRRRYQMGGY